MLQIAIDSHSITSISFHLRRAIVNVVAIPVTHPLLLRAFVRVHASACKPDFLHYRWYSLL